MESGTLIAGRYRLDHLIAWGGMGAVWRGFDTQLDREVGVKVLHRGLEEAQNPQDRFKLEARTLAKLKGPGFVEIYDYGEDSDGDQSLLYIVMELVEGVSLAELLHSQEKLSANRTMQIVAEAAEALEVAHGRGIIHRDIKPANILVDADDRVRVIDFGISKRATGPRLTSTDAVLGTAAYVSPEQLRKDEVTGSADLYALGAVAFECLTGAPPFDSIDREVITHDHLWTAPPPLPDDVPPEVAAVVTRMLQKTPAERWESGTELAQACRAAMRGEPSPWTPLPQVMAEGAQEPVTPESIKVSVQEEPATPPPAGLPPLTRPTRKERRDGMWSWRIGFVAIAVVAIMLLTALFAWSPWAGPGVTEGTGDTTTAAETTTGSDETGDASASVSASESESPETEETSTAAEDTEGDTGGDESDTGGSDGGSNDDSNNEDDSGEAPSGSREMPNVLGRTTFDARDYLYSLGFTNVIATQGYYFGDAADVHCEVGSHSPMAGETVSYSDQINLGYNYEDEANGGGTSCEW